MRRNIYLRKGSQENSQIGTLTSCLYQIIPKITVSGLSVVTIKIPSK